MVPFPCALAVRRAGCDDGPMSDTATAWAWPELLSEMTTRDLRIVGDALYVTHLLGTVDADVLAGETLLDQLTTDQLLDLKLGLRAQLAQLDAAA